MHYRRDKDRRLGRSEARFSQHSMGAAEAVLFEKKTPQVLSSLRAIHFSQPEGPST